MLSLAYSAACGQLRKGSFLLPSQYHLCALLRYKCTCYPGHHTAAFSRCSDTAKQNNVDKLMRYHLFTDL